MEGNSGSSGLTSQDLIRYSCAYCFQALPSVKELLSHRREKHLQEMKMYGVKAPVTKANNNNSVIKTPSPSVAEPQDGVRQLSKEDPERLDPKISHIKTQSPSVAKPQGGVRQLSKEDQERLDWQISHVKTMDRGFCFAETWKSNCNGKSWTISDRNSNEDENESSPGTSGRRRTSATRSRKSASVKRKPEREVKDTAQEDFFNVVVYICKICIATYNSEEELKQHQAEHNRCVEVLECSYCDLTFTFAAKNRLSLHEKVHLEAGDPLKYSTPIKQNSSNGENQRRRPRCVIKEQVKASSGQGMAGNNKKSLPGAKGRRRRTELIASIQTERTSPEKLASNKNKNPPEVYACFNCLAQFPSVAGFKSHYSSVQCLRAETHKAGNTGAKKLPVKKAKSKKDSRKPASMAVSSPGRLQQLGCRFCSRVFSRVNYLRAHEQSHLRRGQTRDTLQSRESFPDTPPRKLKRQHSPPASVGSQDIKPINPIINSSEQPDQLMKGHQKSPKWRGPGKIQKLEFITLSKNQLSLP